MFTTADKTRRLPRGLLVSVKNAFTRMTMTLASSSYSEVRYGVVVRLQHFGVPKNFVAKRVDAVQRDAYVRSPDPFLHFRAVFEVVSRRPTLEGTEGNVATGQR